MRTFSIALVTVGFYIIALMMLDSVIFQARYSHAVWQEASQHVQKVNTEFRHLLYLIGII